MIDKAELDRTVEEAIVLGERIRTWRSVDQGQLTVGCHYANLHIVGLLSTLGGMQGILDHLEKAAQGEAQGEAS